MAKTIYYIPNGPKNLRNIFTTLDWDRIAEYYLEVTTSAPAIIATTTKMEISGCEDDIRVHFINYLGTVDSVSTTLQEQEHEVKGEGFEKPTKSPLIKAAHALSRFNIKSNDSFKVSFVTSEENVPYYDELLDSPLAWLEWEGTQNQSDDYIPIVILDKKAVKFKTEDRFYYEVVLEFKLSNERFIIRN